ncbi:MAG: lipopolysaccharide biosynthesis protein [Candidatus Omnitrophica bacterium]|nr:lipopolysaccharide biosynthesis protein [Candidatus Omnitrophota bacterium]
MTEGLAKKTIRGISWNMLSQIIQQVIRFVVIIVLTRFLSPQDFGIFAMAIVFTEFIHPFRERGFQIALVQKDNIDEGYQSTAFWSICCLAVVLYAISYISAPFVGWFFHSPLLAQIIPVIALIFLMTPFGAIQWALLNRKLDFKLMAFIETVAVLGYGVAACILVSKGFGVWSLVLATLIREFIYSLMFWFSHSWRPLFKFSFKKFKELLRFGASCTGADILNYGINYFDNMMVGKFLGAAPLGFYNLAFNTITQPETKIIWQVVGVVLPVYSLIKDDQERIRRAYLKTIKMVMIIIVPIISILFIEASDFVLTFYGSKWLPTVLPIRIMCFYGLIRALTCIATPIFLSKGRPDIEFKLTIFRLCIFVLSVFIGIRYGIIGVSTAILFYALVSFFPTFYLSDKLLGIRHRVFYVNLLKYAAFLFVIIGLLGLSNYFLARLAIQSHLLRLLSNSCLGLFIYFFLLFIFSKDDLDYFIAVIKKAFI